MKIIKKFKLKGQNLSNIYKVSLVADSIGMITFQFDLDDVWGNTQNITAVIKNGGDVYQCLLDEENQIAFEDFPQLKVGDLELTVFADNLYTTNMLKFEVVESGLLNVPTFIPLDIYNQILTQSDLALEQSTQALNLANDYQNTAKTYSNIAEEAKNEILIVQDDLTEKHEDVVLNAQTVNLDKIEVNQMKTDVAEKYNAIATFSSDVESNTLLSKTYAENAAESESATREIYEEINSKIIKKYGVRRSINQQSSELERIWDAVNLTANVGINDETVVNDFDNIYPWSHMKECNIKVNDGEVFVAAYKGDPEFTLDGSNGDVAIEIPIFYQSPNFIDDDYEYWGISEFAIGGWNLNPIFIDSNGNTKQKIYVAKYNASLNEDDDTKLISKTNSCPLVNIKRGDFRTLARNSGVHLIDLQYHNLISDLFTVEFATLNSQSIMKGLVDLPRSDTVEIIFSDIVNNEIILSEEFSGYYLAGHYINILNAEDNTVILENKKITNVEYLDNGDVKITIDGESTSLTGDFSVVTVAMFSGSTDDVEASSGSINSNLSGKYACKYRGIENPWGNIYQWIDGININNYQSYICTNPNEYADNLYEDSYVNLNYINADVQGWVSQFGYDQRYPFARMPIATTSTSTINYSDLYYCGDGEKAVYIGGFWANKENAGLNYIYASNNNNVKTSYIGVRVYWKG